MFDHSVDVTELSMSSDAAYEFKQAAFTPAIDFRKLSAIRSTEFSSNNNRSKSNLHSVSEDVTPFASVLVTPDQEDEFSFDAFVVSDEVATAAGSRMKLLARSYAGGKSDKEMLSRIEILTQRLRKLSPRTTEAQIAAQEQVVQLVEDVDSGLQAIRAKLNSL